MSTKFPLVLFVAAFVSVTVAGFCFVFIPLAHYHPGKYEVPSHVTRVRYVRSSDFTIDGWDGEVRSMSGRQVIMLFPASTANAGHYLTGYYSQLDGTLTGFTVCPYPPNAYDGCYREVKQGDEWHYNSDASDAPEPTDDQVRQIVGTFATAVSAGYSSRS